MEAVFVVIDSVTKNLQRVCANEDMALMYCESNDNFYCYEETVRDFECSKKYSFRVNTNISNFKQENAIGYYKENKKAMPRPRTLHERWADDAKLYEKIKKRK